MNCFGWHNRASDYLDGTLTPTLRLEADRHLEECKECATRFSRYRKILSAVSSHPRVQLPVALRKNPLHFPLPRIGFGKLKKSQWDKAPWFVRTGIEGAGITLLILTAVALIPRVRTLYERSMERKLDAFNLSDLLNSKESDPAAPLQRGKAVAMDGAQGTPGAHDEFNGEGEADSGEDDSEGGSADDSDIKVGSSEIWRFNIRTDSPREMRAKIVQILTDIKSSKEGAIGGIEAPGGIQFDLLVSPSAVSSLKQQLQKLATIANGVVRTEEQEAKRIALPQEAFTWYKNKSKKKIPAGKTRVVIWLSQM